MAHDNSTRFTYSNHAQSEGNNDSLVQPKVSRIPVVLPQHLRSAMAGSISYLNVFADDNENIVYVHKGSCYSPVTKAQNVWAVLEQFTELDGTKRWVLTDRQVTITYGAPIPAAPVEFIVIDKVTNLRPLIGAEIKLVVNGYAFMIVKPNGVWEQKGETYVLLFVDGHFHGVEVTADYALYLASIQSVSKIKSAQNDGAFTAQELAHQLVLRVHTECDQMYTTIDTLHDQIRLFNTTGFPQDGPAGYKLIASAVKQVITLMENIGQIRTACRHSEEKLEELG